MSEREPDIGGAVKAWREIRNVLRDAGDESALACLEELSSGYEFERKMRDGAERQKAALTAERDAARTEAVRLRQVEADARSDDGACGDGYRLRRERDAAHDLLREVETMWHSLESTRDNEAHVIRLRATEAQWAAMNSLLTRDPAQALRPGEPAR